MTFRYILKWIETKIEKKKEERKTMKVDYERTCVRKENSLDRFKKLLT